MTLENYIDKINKSRAEWGLKLISKRKNSNSYIVIKYCYELEQKKLKNKLS